jgi:hypothetical protein
MATIIIEGDPGQLRHLLDELYDRNYLPDELRVTEHDDDSVQLLREVISGVNDEWSRWFSEPLLQDDERKWLERAEEFVKQARAARAGARGEGGEQT